MRQKEAARGIEEEHPVAPTFGRLSLLRKQTLAKILASPALRSRLERRFFAKGTPDGECLRWTGSRIPAGYGVFFVARADGELLKDGAHRIALALKLGRPLDLDALHSCNHPWCVRPEHLSEGTHSANLGQMVREGRSSHGEQRWSAKITAADVVAMRAVARAGVPVRDLAAHYGLSLSQATRVVRGENWKHVGMEAA